MDKSYPPWIRNSKVPGNGRVRQMGRLPGSPAFQQQLRTEILRKRQLTSCNSAVPLRRHIPVGACARLSRACRNPLQMTIELQGPRAKLAGGMDAFVPSPEFCNISPSESDHSLPTGDLAPYAASPNSLYMYEQEKHDMQNTINGSLCNPATTSTTFLSKEDFDLKPQYELSSLDLSLAESCLNPGTPTSSSSKLWIKTENFLDSDLSSDAIFSMDNGDMSNGPTLAELNMDESLIDEVVNLVNADSALSTVVGSALKGDNSVSLSSILCAPPMNVSKVTDYHQPSAKMATCNVSQRNGIPPSFSQSVAPSPKPTSSRTLLTHVSHSVPQSTAPSSTVTSNFQTEKSNTMTNFLANKPRFQFQRVQKPHVQDSVHGCKSSNVMTNFQNQKSTPGQIPTSTTLHKLLLQKCMGPVRAQSLGSTSTTVVPMAVKRSATIAHLGNDEVEEKWREIEKYIHDTGEDAKSSTSSYSKRSRHDSGSSVLTSNEDPESDNDVFSDRDSDLDDDLSDEEGTLSQLSALEDSLAVSGKKKDKQYFWQYNVQSKGPKGTRLRLELDSSDPYHLKNFEDPVFDPNNTQVAGIRHGGKARKGDGNDVRPNPKRLCQIGMQIKRLNRKINEVTSMAEATASARNQSRKEKNKLASRACRLKKKAQHEANKVKLYGLEREHHQLMDVMTYIHAELKKHLLEKGETTPKQSLVDKLEELIKTHLKEMIAGHTTDFVNKVVAAYEKGDPAGGLDLRK